MLYTMGTQLVDFSQTELTLNSSRKQSGMSSVVFCAATTAGAKWLQHSGVTRELVELAKAAHNSFVLAHGIP